MSGIDNYVVENTHDEVIRACSHKKPKVIICFEHSIAGCLHVGINPFMSSVL